MQEIPMLAILIVFARLRARVDLEGSNPQSWVQLVFIVAVSIVYFQALVITCCSPGKEGNASEKKEANNLKKAVKIIILYFYNFYITKPENFISTPLICARNQLPFFVSAFSLSLR